MLAPRSVTGMFAGLGPRSRIAVLLGALLLASCSKTIDDRGSSKVDFSSPKRVLSSVFYAARTGEIEHLASLCDPENSSNKHAKRICSQVKGGADWASFERNFQKAKLIGEARISGDRAMVNFVFGVDGTKSETMELVRREGRWYLVAF